MSFHLRIEKDEVSGETGIRTFWLRVVEKDAQGKVIAQGPKEGRSIDEKSLDDGFGGSYRTWLETHVKPNMIRYHRESRLSRGIEAASLKGQDL